MSAALSATCKTYAKPHSSCTASALKELEVEFKRLGLSETEQVADLEVSLRCNKSRVTKQVGDVKYDVLEQSTSLAITTRHGVEFKEPWPNKDPKALDDFLSGTNGYSVKIAPDPGLPYSILEPVQDKADALDIGRTIRCLSKNKKVAVKRGEFTYEYVTGKDEGNTLRLPRDRTLFYQLRCAKTTRWPEEPKVVLCIGLRAVDCTLPVTADETLLRGELSTTQESPAVSLEGIPRLDSKAESLALTVTSGMPWIHSWKIPTSFSPNTAATLIVGQTDNVGFLLKQEVPSWSPLIKILPESLQDIVQDTYPNSIRFGLALILVFVVGTSALAWLKAADWGALIKRLFLGPPPEAQAPAAFQANPRARRKKKRRH